MAKTLTINTEKPKSSYSLKGITNIKLVSKYNTFGDNIIQNMIADVEVKGKYLYVTMNMDGGIQGTLKFTDFSKIKNMTMQYADVNLSAGDLYNCLNAKISAKTVTEPTKGKVTGTMFDDVINLYESAYVAPATGKNKGKGITITGGNGNDKISGTKYNDKITGGKGTNIIDVFTTKNFGNDEVVLTKDEKLEINLNGNSAISEFFENVYVHYVGKNMVIDVYDKAITWADDSKTIIADNFDGNNIGSITIKNYTKKDVMGARGNLKITDGSNSWVIKGYSNTVYMDKDHYNKTSFKGTWVQEDVDAKGFKLYKNGKKISTDSSKGTEITTATAGFEKTKGVTINLGDTPSWYSEPWPGVSFINYGTNWAEGSIYADTIKGGFGNDHIWAGKGNDVITGGKGENTYYYYEGDGADTINVTKGEVMKLDINLDSETTVNNLKMKYANKNKDLKIYSTDAEGKEIGSITLKGFAKKDITNNAYAFISVSDGESDYDYLRTLYLKTDVTVETNAKKNFTGTWMDDDITADYKAYKKVGKNKVEITTETAGYQTTKGLTLKGAGGNDNIIGSIYADTIKGGTGDDIITGGAGNDKLYGEKGENTFIFKAGDGKDKVYSGKGTDTLKFENSSGLNFEKKKRDLIIRYNNDQDAVTIKNYYNKKGKPSSSVKYIDLGGNVFNIETLKDYVDKGAKIASSSISGTEGDDIIIGTGKAAGGGNTYQNIYGNGGNDIVNINSSKDETCFIFNVNENGTFAEGNDKLLLATSTYFNSWKTSGAEPTNSLTINDFDSIETIKTSDGYYINTTKLNTLKSDVASWLTSANGGAGYADVVTAIKNNDADLSTLIAMFNRDSNWS